MVRIGANYWLDINGSADAIISIDMNSNIMNWNNDASRLYGYDVAEILVRKVPFCCRLDHVDK